MSGESDFLKPEPDQALRQSEILAVRTLTAHVETLGTIIESLRVDMREVRDKVITFEAVKLEAQITAIRHEMAEQAAKMTVLEIHKASNNSHDALDRRVQALEKDKSEASGAQKFAKAVREWAPPVLFVLGAVILYFTKYPLA
ncbi:hypothetical protein [Asticcacaulis sp.]|uniref:hypothetical protein n=1 Tax=Asticcacaulis sp. TaxID=1872648 RepID=UPI002B55573A|nr:hypothetical protein [Asticcacaulis sp.]HTM79774.1 hypothetical protein [Asticcacaulis sp.]